MNFGFQAISPKFRFSIKFSEKFRFLRQFHKALIFQDKFPKNFDFFLVISQQVLIFRANFRKISIFRRFHKNFDLPSKNWLSTAISGQIILFLFKSHHFRTYSLYMNRYNNILRPVHDPPATPHDPLPKIVNLGGRDPPTPQD